MAPFSCSSIGASRGLSFVPFTSAGWGFLAGAMDGTEIDSMAAVAAIELIESGGTVFPEW